MLKKRESHSGSGSFTHYGQFDGRGDCGFTLRTSDPGGGGGGGG